MISVQPSCTRPHHSLILCTSIVAAKKIGMWFVYSRVCVCVRVSTYLDQVRHACPISLCHPHKVVDAFALPTRLGQVRLGKLRRRRSIVANVDRRWRALDDVEVLRCFAEVRNALDCCRALHATQPETVPSMQRSKRLRSMQQQLCSYPSCYRRKPSCQDGLTVPMIATRLSPSLSSPPADDPPV